MTNPMIRKNLVPWFGSCANGAPKVGRQLGPLVWCGVPFAGGMPELPHINTRAGVANDLHRHVINLARVVRRQSHALEIRLRDRVFHPDELELAQRRCRDRQESARSGLFGQDAKRAPDDPDVDWAADYFVSCWMGRGGNAGKITEFGQSLSTRWSSSGGSSARRFQSAIDSLRGWADALATWEFTTIDAIDFIGSVEDTEGHGLYLDPPWPDVGEEYAHRVSRRFHESVRASLERFRDVRIVVRYGVHPLIEALYPRDRWTWIESKSINQKGNEVREVLIVNGPANPGSPDDETDVESSLGSSVDVEA